MRVKSLAVIAAVLAVLSLAACGEHANNITGPYNDATVKPAAASAAPSPSSSSGGRRRGAVSVPLLQFEGDLTAVSSASITVADSHKVDVDITINTETVIRKGGTLLSASDLKVGDQVHVKAALKNDVKIATEIIVQNGSDDQGDDGANVATANGIVSSTGASSLVVHRAEGDDVTVQINAATNIKKKGVAIALSDIHAGDRVECRGTRIDAHTILAIQIEVEDAHGNGHH
jgi:hypothetical protein